MRFLFAFVCFMCLGVLLNAQPIKPSKMSLSGQAYVFEGKIIMRWMPSSAEAWRYANHYGYNLTRYKIVSGGNQLNWVDIDNSATKLLENAVPPDYASFPIGTDYLKILRSCLYDSSFQTSDVSTLDFKQVMEKQAVKEMQYTMTLLTASQDIEAAKVALLGFEDTSPLEADAEYLYQLEFAGVDTAVTEASPLIFNILPTNLSTFPIQSISSIIAGNKSAILNWDVSQSKQDYDSYMIQRREINTNNWVTVTDKPVLYSGDTDDDMFHYRVALPKNDTIYYFRIAGVTNYGELQSYGPEKEVMGIPDLVQAYPNIYNVVDSIPGKITLKWSFPVDSLIYIKGYNVFRSKLFSGPFVKLNNTLLTKTDSIFVDNSPFASNYYVIEALDKYDRALASPASLAQPFDTTAPGKPVGLAGKSNFKGEILLKWSKSKEEDLYGYRVYISNNMNGEYLQISKEVNQDTVSKYYPELQKLTKEIWFKVSAEDHRENVSPLSDPVMVKIKDIVPPPCPLIEKAVANPGVVDFQFGLSASDDLLKFVFQRRKLPGPKWTNLIEFTPSSPLLVYSDNSADPRLQYEYRLLAVDDVGNKSSSIIVKIKPIDNKVRAPIQNFGGTIQVQQRVFLQWNYVNDVDLYGFQIWRGIDTSQTRPYVFITKEEAISNYLAGGMGSLPNVNGSLKFGFWDMNVNLNTIKKQSTYKNTGGLTSVLPQGQGGNVTPLSPNQQLPNGQGVQHSLKYQVKAIYMDDASSPKSNILQFNN